MIKKYNNFTFYDISTNYNLYIVYLIYTNSHFTFIRKMFKFMMLNS